MPPSNRTPARDDLGSAAEAILRSTYTPYNPPPAGYCRQTRVTYPGSSDESGWRGQEEAPPPVIHTILVALPPTQQSTQQDV